MPWLANKGEAAVELSVPEPDTVCVSITEPIGEERRREPARLPKGFVDVLRLEFQDFDGLRKHPPDAVLFTVRQAAQIQRFARKHRGRNILVHCAAGISRSGAIVEALLEAFPEYEDRGWPRHPNGHVKSIMKRALGLTPLGHIEVVSE